MKPIQINIIEDPNNPNSKVDRYSRLAEVEDSGPLITAIEAFLNRKPRKQRADSGKARTEVAT